MQPTVQNSTKSLKNKGFSLHIARFTTGRPSSCVTCSIWYSSFEGIDHKALLLSGATSTVFPVPCLLAMLLYNNLSKKKARERERERERDRERET